MEAPWFVAKKMIPSAKENVWNNLQEAWEKISNDFLETYILQCENVDRQ